MIVLALLTSLGACRDDDDDESTTTMSAVNTTPRPDTSSPATGSIGGPVLTSPARPLSETDGMGADVMGMLRFDDSTNCLLMKLEVVRFPLIWPAGTSWQEDPPAVVLKDGETIVPGTLVYGGGGYLHRGHVEQVAGAVVADAAERCAGPTGEIAFFNIESDVDVLG